MANPSLGIFPHGPFFMNDLLIVDLMESGGLAKNDVCFSAALPGARVSSSNVVYGAAQRNTTCRQLSRPPY